MSFLPPPLDSLYVLIAVILGIFILALGLKKNREASKRLDAVRKEKSRRLREARMAVKDKESL